MGLVIRYLVRTINKLSYHNHTATLFFDPNHKTDRILYIYLITRFISKESFYAWSFYALIHFDFIALNSIEIHSILIRET